MTLALPILLASTGFAQTAPPAPADANANANAAAAEAPAPDATTELRRVQDELVRLREEITTVRHTLDRDRATLERYGAALDEVRDAGRDDRVAYGSVVRVERGEQVAEVVGFGDDVVVAGHVHGDATSFGGNVVVEPTGRIEGDAISFGGRVDVRDGGVVGGGKLSMEVPGVAAVPAHDEGVQAVGAVGALGDPAALLQTMYRRLILLLSFAGAGVLIVGLFPRRVGRIALALEERPLRSAIVGALGTTFLGLFSLLFAVITFGLGLPVSMMVWALLGLAWMLGFVGLCQAVGDRLPFEQKPHGRWVAFLVGTILLTCAGSLPLVGVLVLAAASTVGVGAALSTRFGGAE